MKPNLFSDLGPRLWNLGYEVLPLDGKKATIAGWPNLDLLSNRSVVDGWAADPHRSKSNVGLRTGPAIMLDIDIVDMAGSEEVINIVDQIAPGFLIRRRGNGGKCALLWKRAEGGSTAEATGPKSLTNPNIDKGMVEFYETPKFQMGIYSEGLEGGDYVWEGDGPLDRPFADLAGISLLHLKQIRQALKEAGYAQRNGSSKDDHIQVPGHSFFEKMRENILSSPEWNNTTFKAVGELIKLGLDDRTILAQAVHWTQPAYTVEETVAEVSDMLMRLRSKEAQRGQFRSSQNIPSYEKFRETWAYLATQNRFYNSVTSLVLEERSWKTAHQHLRQADLSTGKLVPYTHLWLNDPESTRLNGETWRPAQGPITADGYLNRWKPHCAHELLGQGDPNGEAAVLVDKLLTHLCEVDLRPERKEILEHLKAWISFGLFHPNERVLWAVMLVSEAKGTGKSTLASIIADLYGPDLSKELDGLGKLAGRFQSSLMNVMFVSVAELVDRGMNQNRFNAIESIKSLITDPRIEIEQKHKDPISIENYMRCMFSSNHKDGFGIDANERRIFPIVSERADILGSEFFTRLHELKATQQGLADIAAYFHQFDAGSLPARAPEGDLKEIVEALEASWLTELIDKLTYLKRPYPELPIDKDISLNFGYAFQYSELQKIAKHLEGKAPSNAVMSGQLKTAGFTKKRAVVPGTGKKLAHYVYGNENAVKGLTVATDLYPELKSFNFDRN